MVMKKQAIALGMALSCAAAAAIAEVDSLDYDVDQKYYSAAGCAAQNAAAAVIGTGGGINNTSTTANNNLTCPVILDRFYYNQRYFYLVVYRAAGAGPMTCYLSTRYGSSVTTTNQTVGTTGTESTVSFYRNAADDAASIGCTTPRLADGVRSGIMRYYVYEY